MNSDNKQIRDVADVAARIMAGLPPIKEALHPNQQKIDVVDDEKIDGKDFAKLRAGKKPDVKKEEVEQQDEAMSHQAATTMKHIPNPTPAQKQAAKDIKPGVGGYRDRVDMLKSAGVKEEVEQQDEATYDHKKAMQSQNPRIQKKGIGGAMDNAAKRIQQTIKDVPLNSLEKRYKEEVEQEEYTFADYLDAVRTQYGDEDAVLVANEAFKNKDITLFSYLKEAKVDPITHHQNMYDHHSQHVEIHADGARDAEDGDEEAHHDSAEEEHRDGANAHKEALDAHKNNSPDKKELSSYANAQSKRTKSWYGE